MLRPSLSGESRFGLRIGHLIFCEIIYFCWYVAGFLFGIVAVFDHLFFKNYCIWILGSINFANY